MTTRMLWEPTDTFAKEVARKMGLAGPRTLSRDALCDRIMAMYRNDFGGLVDEALQSIFHPDNYRHLRLHLHTSTNLLERVLEETCLVYQEPASRYLKGDVESDGARASATGEVGDLLDLTDEELVALPAEEPLSAEQGDDPRTTEEEPAAEAAAEPVEATSALDKLLEHVDLDGLMDEVHKLGRILPALWIMPVVRADPSPEDEGRVRLDFDIYTPVNSGVETDPKDPTQAVAFWTEREEVRANGQKVRVRYRWDRLTFTKWDDKGHKIPNDLAPDEVNPLRRLPVTPLRLGRPLDSYYLDGQGVDLYEATLEVSVLRTLQNARYRDSSFKQLVIDGSPKDIPPDQVMGNPAIPIYVNEGTASVLDLQVNLEQFSRVVRERVEDVIVRYGISPASWSMTERAQSGFSKKMDQAKVQAMNRRERKYLAACERDLYALTALVLQFWPVPEIGTLDPEAEFVVDYAEPVYEEDPQTQARADSIAIKLNRTNYLELLMRDNPDLTEREALARLALNRLINERFAGMARGGESQLMDILSGTKQTELAIERLGGKGGAPGDDDGGEAPPEPPPPGEA